MQLSPVDTAVFVAYLVGVALFGVWFARRKRDSKSFMAAGGSLPGWAVGLSIFGTFLSSATFIGSPGQTYAGNWNFFVFCAGIPPAVWIASRWFIPFYRRSGQISAYVHLEERFAPWARNYALLVFLISEIARIASVTFGVSLAMSVLTGWDVRTLIIVGGIVVTLYTTMGGIEAVIWTDVAQSIVLTLGAALVALILLSGTDTVSGSQLIKHAIDNNKFSLGNWDATRIDQSTVWTVFFVGLFTCLNRFGINQSYVQRYHTARTDRAAQRSLWIGGLIYIPIAALFYLIGTLLWSHHALHPSAKQKFAMQIAEQQLATDGELNDRTADERNTLILNAASKLESANLADKAFPAFISRGLPVGLAGLLVAALFAAGMSTIDTGLNSCATVYLEDIHKRWFGRDPTEQQAMRTLQLVTVIAGSISIGAALLLVGVNDLLQTIWVIEGVSFAATLGLFLLGFFVHRASSEAAAIGTAAGLVTLLWLVLSIESNYQLLPEWMRFPASLRSPFHKNMNLFVGTAVMFGVGWLASLFLPRKKSGASS